MIQVKITPEIIRRAKKKAASVGVLQGSITGSLSNVVGAIGEIIVQDYTGGIEANSKDYDLMVGNRKLGGLLIEVSSRPLIAALGIGLNLENAPKSDNFESACLLDFGVSIKPIKMSKLITQKLGVWIERWSLNGLTPVINQWKAWGKGIGETIRVRIAEQTIVDGKFIDIDKEGRMLLELSNGRSMTISAGDVLFE